MDERKKTDILRAFFDALPSLVFVVDQDVRIQEYNAAASDLLMAERMTVIKQRAGETLHCVHAIEVPEGCGRASSCSNCIIRNSVTKAFQGNRVVRRRSKIEIIRDGKRSRFTHRSPLVPFPSRTGRLRCLLLRTSVR